jgi:hypothetical protein
MNLLLVLLFTLTGRPLVVDRNEGGLAVVSAGAAGEITFLCPGAREGRALPTRCLATGTLHAEGYEFWGEDYSSGDE